MTDNKLAIFENYKNTQTLRRADRNLVFLCSESVTICHRLKMEAAHGKKYLTDVADSELVICFCRG